MVETISDLARAALALQRGTAAEAAEILLDLLAKANDPAAAALIHSARATLIQWVGDEPIPA